MENFGDRLNNSVQNIKSLLFLQGEMAQLSYQAFDAFIGMVNKEESEKIPITYPVGYNADNTPINSTHEYTKEELIGRYKYLAFDKLPLDGIYQLVTLMESLFGDIIRMTLIEFPGKIGNKRKLDSELALSASSLEEIKISIVNIILNELAYKNPKDYAEEFNKYIGINLLEFPPYHKYVELKATRDIHIHNRGIANEIYLSKASTLARVRNNEFLPVHNQYFLQSYEACLQTNEFLEAELDKIWPSPKYRESKEAKSQSPESETQKDQVEKLIEESKETKKPKS